MANLDINFDLSFIPRFLQRTSGFLQIDIGFVSHYCDYKNIELVGHHSAWNGDSFRLQVPENMINKVFTIYPEIIERVEETSLRRIMLSNINHQTKLLICAELLARELTSSNNGDKILT